MESERLQKILSRAGYGSRRECEKLISAGRVTINGQTAKLGDKGNLIRDIVCVDDVPLKIENRKNIYIALNKPPDVLSENKKVSDRKTVLDMVDIENYVFIVGRLDYRSEGLILLTNDGDLANKLTHPRYEHEKEYRVLLDKHLSQHDLEKWREGIILESGYKTLPADIVLEDSDDTQSWIRIILKEGKKRQIRECAQALGYQVQRLMRVRICTLKMGKLGPGEWRYLSDDEIEVLIKTSR